MAARGSVLQHQAVAVLDVSAAVFYTLLNMSFPVCFLTLFSCVRSIEKYYHHQVLKITLIKLMSSFLPSHPSLG